MLIGAQKLRAQKFEYLTSFILNIYLDIIIQSTFIWKQKSKIRDYALVF